MEVKLIRTEVKNYVIEGHNFIIKIDETGHYWGIDKTLINDEGKLIKEINGITGHRSETLCECLRSCYVTARFENEIDKEKFMKDDITEMLKLAKISEDSFNIIP